MAKLSAEEISSRKAWRAILIPAVGSAALFASMVINVIKTHKQHGWPHRAFKRSDYLLMTIPFLIVGLAITEEVVVGEDAK
tara:strand:+ start:382 stop:624 length:243 start_codon:yes stop_codon:yes gene_type:complete